MIKNNPVIDKQLNSNRRDSNQLIANQLSVRMVYTVMALFNGNGGACQTVVLFVLLLW